MDPTTLMTFLFETTANVRLVELLGSWDNFRQPYMMHHDRRRGKGFWTGCFKFNNIIFDGERSQRSRPRTGGLKQGGTYWYYYRLDDHVEACDEKQLQTSTCPLLPGQPVNIVEVPIELVGASNRSRSASMDLAASLADQPQIHTWDPADKFMALKPPSISKVHGRCVSEVELGTQLKDLKLDSYSPPSIPPTRVSSSRSFPAQRQSSHYASVGHVGETFNHVEVGRETSAYDEHEQACAQIIPSIQQPAMNMNMNNDIKTTQTHLLGTCLSITTAESNIPDCVDPDVTTIDHPEALQDVFPRPPTAVQSAHYSESLLLQQIHRTQDTYEDNIDQRRRQSEAAPSFECIERNHLHVRVSHDMPHDEHAMDEEIWSPTLSADTASSYGDFNTPYRVGEREWPISSLDEHPALMDVVSQRLQDLQTRSHAEQESLLPFRAPLSLPMNPLLQSYSLPLPATESMHSLNKLSTSSIPSSIHERQQEGDQIEPPISSARVQHPTSDIMDIGRMDDSTKTSLADHIFSELGLLGTSLL